MQELRYSDRPTNEVEDAVRSAIVARWKGALDRDAFDAGMAVRPIVIRASEDAADVVAVTAE